MTEKLAPEEYSEDNQTDTPTDPIPPPQTGETLLAAITGSGTNELQGECNIAVFEISAPCAEDVATIIEESSTSSSGGNQAPHADEQIPLSYRPLTTNRPPDNGILTDVAKYVMDKGKSEGKQ